MQPPGEPADDSGSAQVQPPPDTGAPSGAAPREGRALPVTGFPAEAPEVVAARLAAIINSSDDAIVSKTLQGVITSWNPSAERMFGYTAAEAVGRHISLIIPPDRLGEEEQVLARLGRGERIDHFETVRRARNGRLLAISLTVSPIRDSTGRIVGASKVARDITERRRAEAEREQLLSAERAARGEAERAGRLKDEFLATLSHELRTPLAAIVGWAEILSRGTADPGTVVEGAGVILRNARLQARLVADLLDMSRIISGKMRLEVERVDLPAVIYAAVESVKPAAEARGVRLATELEPLPGPVYGDAARLQQIVWNLLSNAIKFTPRGGQVLLRLARAESHLELAVSDTGAGITSEFLPHVFERFSQANGSAARRHGGLGLGLAIVKQLTELHGGSVRAESAGADQGSTFTVRLPLAPAYISAAGGGAEGGAGGFDLKGVHVLVVDDEADARGLLKRLLAESGAAVTTADSADSAAAAHAGRDQFDVILSDIGLPGRDGLDLMRSLRSAGVRTPAAALTAFARDEDRARALEAGYQLHIAKPVERTQLLGAVASLARRPR
ncbi:MAG TPA: ATP-binding protein [Phycisphaerales bacterium]|nr:ATP-binding protein [Phycisphaerales bacterium]